jgi:hypothetical protein
MAPGDAGLVAHARILIAATACAIAVAVAIARGGLGDGAAVVLVPALLLFVRAAFRLVDDVERHEEERARQPRGTSKSP